MEDIRAEKAMISTGHPLSAEAGLEALKRGGNAVDAAVAAAFVDCVVLPEMCGIGGYGGCMAVYMSKTGKTIGVDFNCCAGKNVSPEMYQLEPAHTRQSLNTYEYKINVRDDANIVGFTAVGVPGIVAGFGLAHSEFGRLRWKDLLTRAIEVAESGFVVDPVLAAHTANNAEKLKRFPSLCALIAPNGEFPKTGDTLKFPALARTLKVIASEGPRAFYTGEIAKKLSDYILAHGGHITTEDLQSYTAFICEPARIRYRGYDIVTPPLSNGGPTTLQILKILEGFPLAKMDRESPELIHLFVEAAKLAWDDRLKYFADPRVVPVDQNHFLSEAHAARLRKLIRPAAHHSASSHPSSSTSDHTTHISVVDEERNFVTVTFTHGMLYGACVAVPELGVILGDGMFRFDPRPAHLNSVSPGKRVLNNAVPLLIMRNGWPYITSGTPGGRKILSAMTWLSINLLDFGMGPAQALAFPRCHCEEIEPVLVENPTTRPVDGAPGAAAWRDADGLKKGLEALGHTVRFEPRVGGNAHVIIADPGGGLRSGVDPRGLGAVRGY